MSEARHLRCYAFVERPYVQVRDRLRLDALEVVRRATDAASSRADALVASLKLQVGGQQIAVDARTAVRRIREEEGVAGLPPVTVLSLGWEGLRLPALFPQMRAELSAWPLSSDETQLELTGDYDPPLGVLGSALDALVLHHVAEAVVHRFLEDVARELRLRRTVTHGHAGTAAGGVSAASGASGAIEASGESSESAGGS